MKRAARAKSLPRTELGNPILRKKAARVPLSYLTTDEFKQLERNMIRTMRSAKGVGVAAPQVGVPLRIAVMETRPTPTRPGLARKGPLVMINPIITEYGTRIAYDWEGCLSLSGFRGSVPRSERITVTYWNSKGERITENADGLWARIFQHEIDHLDGIVYLDRMKDMRTLMTLSEFRTRILGKK